MLLTGCGDEAASSAVIRLGHFPNVTHAHGLVAHALSRRGEGVFEKHLGKDVRVEWFVFNAGPSAMESLLAGSLDATYVGPNPALNAYLRTSGQDVRVIAGATKGGAALVVRADAGITAAADLRGKKVATPQLGNTQDVSCRSWLRSMGFAVSQTGGDVLVVPTANPDQLSLFQTGDLDAAWTVEPWVSRLEMEGGGKVLVSEPEAVTTVFVSSVALLDSRPEVARRLLDAHRELTAWIAAHDEEARQLVKNELETLTGRPISMQLIEHSWPRLRFTDDVTVDEFDAFLRKAKAAGFVSGAPDLSRLVPR